MVHVDLFLIPIHPAYSTSHWYITKPTPRGGSTYPQIDANINRRFLFISFEKGLSINHPVNYLLILTKACHWQH